MTSNTNRCHFFVSNDKYNFKIYWCAQIVGHVWQLGLFFVLLVSKFIFFIVYY